MSISVLFVCLGNICRSPTAEGVFRKLVSEHPTLKHKDIVIDSAGTAAWHIGKTPDKRTQQAALTRGYNLSQLKARQVSAQDLKDFEFVLAMDCANLNELVIQAKNEALNSAHIELFLSYADGPENEVPDPYYGGAEGFEQVLDLVEQASIGLIQHLTRELD